MRVSRKFTRSIMSMVALSALAIASLPSSALALGFSNGDLGFFVYGGNDQRY